MITLPGQVERTMQILRKQFGRSLVALYLHGSAVADGLRPYSDLDLLAVIDRPLTTKGRVHLTAELMKISGRPGENRLLRPLELIIFLHADLAASPYPAHGELVYGEWLRDAVEAGEMPSAGSDPELTLVLAQARQQARALIGPDATRLLPVVPQADIHRAIADVLPTLLSTLEGDERNVLLTFARMWRTLSTGEFVSKDAAASWALPHLPADQAALLADARDAYLGIRQDDLRTRWQEVRQTAECLHACVLRALWNQGMGKAEQQ